MADVPRTEIPKFDDLEAIDRAPITADQLVASGGEPVSIDELVMSVSETNITENLVTSGSEQQVTKAENSDVHKTGGVYRFLVHVNGLPGATDILAPARDALITGAEADNGRVVAVYKIMGENGIVAVIQGGIEGAIDLLTKTVGASVEFDTKPLRCYENFAKNVLGVEESLCEIGDDNIPTENRQIFWVFLSFEHRGLTLEEFKATWKKEALFVLGGRQAGQLDHHLYKGIAAHTVHAFLSLADGDAMDDAAFAIPISQLMGEGVKIICRPVRPF